MSELAGRRLGPYELRDVLRRGHTATRYRAVKADRPFVVTVYEPEHDETLLQALRSDIRAVAALRHPNVVSITDVGEEAGHVFTVEDYFGPRLTLADRPSASMDPAGAVSLMSYVLSGLGHAHEHGVVHASVTPRHVVLAPPMRPVLVDFAVGREAGGRMTDPVTGARLVVGTAAYLAPEQAFGLPADVRSDLYSAGIVLYELLTGRVPFESERTEEVLQGHASQPPTPVRRLRPELRPELAETVMRTLAKDPGQRPATARELADELSAALRTPLTPLDPLAADYEAGVRAFARGEWASAVTLLRRVAEVDPDYEDVEDLLRGAEEGSGDEA
ncbi:MAG TPA: serine/threonine-protein kinase [Actinomycetes bacterium]|nr:serine/threonine-protein kinase [Actinomycetes bacterium]